MYLQLTTSLVVPLILFCNVIVIQYFFCLVGSSDHIQVHLNKLECLHYFQLNYVPKYINIVL